MKLDFYSPIYCQECFDEKPKRAIMSKWSQLNVGTYKGKVEVWCKRHAKLVREINVSDLVA